MRMRRSCTSLKLASTHSWSSGTIDISGAPAATRWPTCTAAPRHLPGHRRDQLGALQREPGFAHRGGGALHVRMLVDARAVGQRPVARRLLLARRPAPTAQRPARCALPPARLGVLHLLAADRAAGDQRRAPRDVVAGARQLGCARVRPRPRAAGSAPSRLPLLAYSVRTSRTVCASCASAALQRQPRIGRIEPHQRLAGLRRCRCRRPASRPPCRRPAA